jgi:hypothetical protein
VERASILTTVPDRDVTTSTLPVGAIMRRHIFMLCTRSMKHLSICATFVLSAALCRAGLWR